MLSLSFTFASRAPPLQWKHVLAALPKVPVLPHDTTASDVRCLHRSPIAANFWEPDRKSGYKTKIKKPTPVMIKEGLGQMKGEISKLKDEVVSAARCDQLMMLHHGDYEVVWKFNSKEAVDSWVVTTDADHSEGNSRAEFVFGANQKSIFKGYINTDVPKDGIIKNSGYCNIRSPQNMVLDLFTILSIPVAVILKLIKICSCSLI